MSGGSGKLKTTLIGDYLLHQDLIELDSERETYQKAVENLQTVKAKSKKKDEIEKQEQELKRLKEEYVPIDFQAYTIDDQKSPIMNKRTEEQSLQAGVLEKTIDKDEKMWRISSLTASVDDETTILILPLPESKRKVKVSETKYEAKTYGDFVQTLDNFN